VKEEKMADDIVQELRDFAYIVEGTQGVAAVVMLEGRIFEEAAEEIERLQSIGDMMFNSINYLLGENEPTEDLAELLASWKENRNG
jgi:hypothetical protein